MKKFACLVLSLVLCLSMFCAVAEDTTEAVSPAVTVASDDVTVTPVDAEVLASIKSGAENDALIAAFGDTGDKAVAAYDVFAISAPEATGAMTATFTSATTFTAEQKVVAVLKLSAGWTAYPTEVNGNQVTVQLDDVAVAEMAQGPVPCVFMATVAD